MRLRRILPAALAAAALVALPAVASAHAHFESSTPEPGSNLDTAPTEVVLTFDDELDPDASSFTVTDASGSEVGGGGVDLSVAARDTMRGDVTVEEPGIYTVTYTVRGLDGHDVDGEFNFGYLADEEVPAPDEDHHGTPDTALPGPAGPSIPTLVGLLLLAGAGVRTALSPRLR